MQSWELGILYLTDVRDPKSPINLGGELQYPRHHRHFKNSAKHDIHFIYPL
jgi:hypothetical protein